MAENLGLFDMICVLDYRYYGQNPAMIEKLGPYFSEEAFISYLLKGEIALVKVLAKKGICPVKVVEEVKEAAKLIKAQDVYAEQERIRHPVMSLVNCIRARVSDDVKPYVHFTATSNDMICSADACRHKAFTNQILLPRLLELERTLIDLARREKDTLQIGRTHGQHAEPITFGFYMIQFVSRLGRMILNIQEAANNLRGKMSGAVGAYNALALFSEDPEAFERETLAEIGLSPSPVSTQIVEAEFLVDYVHALISTFGVVANIADDMRQLHRSEIGEVEEFFGEHQVGSSTMPHKINPSRFENVKSLWKAFMPRMITLYADQISEHQRDLTNMESTRFVPEIASALYFSVDILDNTMRKLIVRRDRMEENFRMSEGFIIAEPAHLLLSSQGHKGGHEAIRRLTRESRKQGKDLRELILSDRELAKYLNGLSPSHREVLKDPRQYTGISSKKVMRVCDYWEGEINQLEPNLNREHVL